MQESGMALEIKTMEKKFADVCAFAFVLAHGAVRGIESALQEDSVRKRKNIPQGILAREFLAERKNEFRRGQRFFWHVGTRTLDGYMALLTEHLTVNSDVRDRYDRAIKKAVALHARRQRASGGPK